MTNRTLRYYVSLLLLASPVWWTTGCYSTRELIKQDEPGECEVRIVTKGGRSLDLSEARFDGRGRVSGLALKETPTPLASANPVSHGKARVTLPLDSLRNATFSDVTVVTKSGQTMEFDTLMLDGRGILSGSLKVYARYPNNEHKVVVGREYATVRLDDVQGITTETFSPGKTLLLAGSLVGVIYLVALGLSAVVFPHGILGNLNGSVFGKMPG